MKLNIRKAGGIGKLVRALGLKLKRATKGVVSEGLANQSPEPAGMTRAAELVAYHQSKGLDSQRQESAALVLTTSPTAAPIRECTPKGPPATEDEQAPVGEAVSLPKQPGVPHAAYLPRLTNVPPGGLSGTLDYFASHTRAFAMSEFLEWLGSDAPHEEASNTLLSDARFINLGDVEGGGLWLISEQTLFRFWSGLNIRLARLKRPRVTERELTWSMDCLRVEGKWERPPKAAVEFGLKYGLLAAALRPRHYVFPLALMLLHMRMPAVNCAKRLLDRLANRTEQEGLLRLATPDALMESLSSFDRRVVGVATARAGINGGKKLTLQALGEQLGVSRERVRQLEDKFWTAVLDTKREARLEPLVRVFLCDLIAQHGSLLANVTLPDGRARSFLAECLHVPSLDVSDGELLALGVQNQTTGNIYNAELAEVMDPTRVASSWDAFTGGYLPSEDLKAIGVRLGETKSQLLPKYRKVYLALQRIGRPAHYTEVARVYNEMFLDDPCSTHNVHAMLGRCEPDIVWIGIKGTYALREWGFEKPADGLYDQIATIVERVYAETHSPVPVSVIAAELGRLRPIVHPNSLILATSINPALKRVGESSYIPKSAAGPSTEDDASSEIDAVLKNFEQRLK